MTELPHVLRSVPDQVEEGWDAIRVGRFYGLQVLARLHAPGTVAIDPSVTPGVYFFVQVDSAETWPGAPVIRVTTVPPRRGVVRLTDKVVLLDALTEVIPDWAEAASW